jgi:hypothetical protein
MPAISSVQLQLTIINSKLQQMFLKFEVRIVGHDYLERTPFPTIFTTAPVLQAPKHVGPVSNHGLVLPEALQPGCNFSFCCHYRS